MGFTNFFKGKKEGEEFDPLRDLTLSKMKVRYFVEYDLKTWQVTAYNKYDFGDGLWSEEWELTSGREKIWLEKREDDEVEWTVSKKLPLGAIAEDVRQHVKDFDDPPGQISVKEKTFYLDESGSVYYYPGGNTQQQGQGIIAWEYIDDDDENFVSIEQWGEDDFEASQGYYVEEFMFSNILPSGDAQA